MLFVDLTRFLCLVIITATRLNHSLLRFRPRRREDNQHLTVMCRWEQRSKNRRQQHPSIHCNAIPPGLAILITLLLSAWNTMSVSSVSVGSSIPEDEEVDYDDDEEIELPRSPQHLRSPAPFGRVEEEEEEEEVTGLMTAETVSREGDFEDEFDDGRLFPGSFRILSISMIVVLVVSTLAVLLPGIGSDSDALESLRTPARIPVEYSCPNEVDKAENYDETFEHDYSEVTDAITQNMTEFLETFREENFDNWGHTYEEVKDGMRHFKSTYYPPYVKDGDSIYESACGIGLNLFMTLEILQEVKGIENLFVYGNEYLENSAIKANAVMDKLAPAHGRKGIICEADSTDLQFIPEKSFDLVYTGYIR